jgi:hypothetical protein
MCDYSLMSFPNRLARTGEMLVVHRFTCGAMGLASPVELSCNKPSSWKARLRSLWSTLQGTRRTPGPITAVCVPHGTRLLVLDIPENLRREMNVQSKEEVTFRQLSVSTFEYRDAIRFGNGRQVLLQKLREGQRVRILNVSGEVENYAWELSDRFGGWQPDLELETAAQVSTRFANIAGPVVV